MSLEKSEKTKFSVKSGDILSILIFALIAFFIISSLYFIFSFPQKNREKIEVENDFLKSMSCTIASINNDKKTIEYQCKNGVVFIGKLRKPLNEIKF